jgi:hypothetical protein
VLFAFAGSAVGFLPKERTAEDLAALGRILFLLSVFVIVGVVAGIGLRNADLLRSGPRPAFVLEPPLTAARVVALKEQGATPEVLRAFILADRLAGRRPHKLTPAEVGDLVKAKVPAEVIEWMLLPLPPEARPKTETFLFRQPAAPRSRDNGDRVFRE